MKKSLVVLFALGTLASMTVAGAMPNDTDQKAAFCNSYATQLVQAWNQGATRGCPHFVSRRNGNTNAGHFKWCMGKSRATAERAIQANKKLAATCR